MDEATQNAAAMWATGDYPAVGARLREASVEVGKALTAAGIVTGDRVLDVGVGSGNTSTEAALTGASVTGIDLSDAWFGAARQQFAEHGVEVDLAIGTVEDLPFDDGTYAAVTSCFAHIFAPQHDRAAREMGRVLAPGGTLVVATWNDHDIDDGFSSLRAYLGEPPEGVGTPDQWGDRAYLAERFAAGGVEVHTVVEHLIDWSFPSRQAVVDFLFTVSGPWMMMKDRLVASGQWHEAEATLHEALERANRRDDGTYGRTMPYLVAIGTKRRA